MRIIGCTLLPQAIDLRFLGSHPDAHHRARLDWDKEQSHHALARHLVGVAIAPGTPPISSEDHIVLCEGDPSLFSSVPVPAYDFMASQEAILYDPEAGSLACAGSLTHDGRLLLTYARATGTAGQNRLHVQALQLWSNDPGTPRLSILTDCLNPIDIEGALRFDPLSASPDLTPADRAHELRRVFIEAINPTLVDPFVVENDPWLTDRCGASAATTLQSLLDGITDAAHAILGEDCDKLAINLKLPGTPAGLPFADITIADGPGITRETRIQFKFLVEWLLAELKPYGGLVIKRRHHAPSQHLHAFYRRSAFTESEENYQIAIRAPGGHETLEAAERLARLERRIAEDPRDLFTIDRAFGRRTMLSQADCITILDALRSRCAAIGANRL